MNKAAKSVGKRQVPESSKSVKSITSCRAPIAGCLREFEKAFDAEKWAPKSRAQETFLTYYSVARQEIREMSELESIVSDNAEVINNFLRIRGFNIKLDPFSKDPPEIGAACIFKLLLEWFQAGTKTTVRHGAYPAVRLDRSILEFYSSEACDNPIVSVKTKSGDRVYMTVVDAEDVSEGLELAQVIQAQMKQIYEYGNVVFPMVSYDSEVDIGWIKGMKLVGGKNSWQIKQALQQTKFRMNEIGAKVESAVAISMMRCTSVETEPDLIIDKPFLLWIMRRGQTYPLFAGYFGEADWKRPASL